MDIKKVWDILVEECDAFKGDYFDCSSFAYNWPDCNEYRFVGNQGFGGKIWAPGKMDRNHAVVTCYPEDDNPERKASRDRANERLKQL